MVQEEVHEDVQEELPEVVQEEDQEKLQEVVQDQDPPLMMLKKSRLILPAIALSLIGAGLLGGCSSMSKDHMQLELAALEGNRALVDLGLQRLELSFDQGAGPAPLEVVYVHLPATRPSPELAPVVLIHGTPGTLYMWSDVLHDHDGAPRLSAERDVYAIEVLGHGIAPGEVEPMTFQRGADFVAAAVQALELPPVHLVGHSYGGEMVWRAAVDHPELFRSITLTSSSGYARTREQFFPEEIEMRENSLADIGWWINAPDRVATALEPHFAELTEERVQEFFLTCENAVNWRAMVDLCQDENGDRSADLARLTLPVLLLWGENDLAFPVERDAVRFLADLPDARMVTITAGHYPPEESPEAYARELEHFFSTLEGGQ